MDDLIAMGFDSAAARAALAQTNGDVASAVEIILLGSSSGRNMLPPLPFVSVFASANGATTAQAGAFNNKSEGGEEEVVQLLVSQYSFGVASSACTAIACSMASVLLGGLSSEANESGVTATATATEVRDASFLTDGMIHGVALYNDLITTSATAAEHLSVQDLIPLPAEMNLVFKGSIPNAILSSRGGTFQRLLRDAAALPGVDSARPFSVIITKPPETVCCVICPNNTTYLFDSHPRPQLGLAEGASLVIGTSVESLALRLQSTFPYFDLGGGGEGEGQGEDSLASQMYNLIDASVFQQML